MKRAYTRQDQIALLTENLIEKAKSINSKGEKYTQESRVFNDVIETAESVVLHYKTLNTETIISILNILIESVHYFDFEKGTQKTVLLNIIDSKVRKMNIAHGNTLERGAK